MTNQVCLFGASGHGKVVKEAIESKGYDVVSFFDDHPTTDNLLGTPVIKTENIKDFLSENFIISIGDNSIRKKISQSLKVSFTSILHESVNKSDTVEINSGTVVMSGVNINANAIIGKHCSLNTSCVVDHDCELHDFVHISPNATLCGNVYIGEGTHIGAGATIIPNLTIGKWATIGAGAVIINNVPDFAVVVGNPGKIIKYNKR